MDSQKLLIDALLIAFASAEAFAGVEDLYQSV